jgi:diguanylate cyclase (GGDEF)-like protein/PAS domain S-box-containing protein
VTEARDRCPRCEVPFAADARYCHACGVSIVAAISGEFETFDLERFFQYALDLLCIAGTDGYLKRVNPAFERVLGWGAKELLSKPFVELIHPDDRQETVAEVGRLGSGRPTLSFENRFRCKDGTYRDLQWTSYPEPATGLLYAVARDVTDWKRTLDQVDGLTGLATRRVFDDLLPKEWSRNARLRTPITLGLVDIDRFREFNKAHGHKVGDQFLRELARVLSGHARRAGDMLARFSGQQFALLWGGGVTAQQAGVVAEHLREAAWRIELDGVPAGTVTVSIGAVSVVPDVENHHRTLLVAAESALEQAKGRGGDGVIVEGAT